MDCYNTSSTVVSWRVCPGTPNVWGPEKPMLCLGSFSKAAWETEFYPVVLAV